MQMIQYGESPNPAKRSEQPVLSLGAAEPLSGEGFFLTMPNCDTKCTNIFLEKHSEQYPDDIILFTSNIFIITFWQQIDYVAHQKTQLI